MAIIVQALEWTCGFGGYYAFRGNHRLGRDAPGEPGIGRQTRILGTAVSFGGRDEIPRMFFRQPLRQVCRVSTHPDQAQN